MDLKSFSWTSIFKSTSNFHPDEFTDLERELMSLNWEKVLGPCGPVQFGHNTMMEKVESKAVVYIPSP
jgi:hypothetical protein